MVNFQDMVWRNTKAMARAAHMRAIQQLGPSPMHRMTFRGVAQTAGSYA